MKIADIPTKFPIPFANSAGVGYVNSIPQLPSPTPGKASLTDGFPPLNFEQIASGGVPPWGADMNGLQKQITQWLQWATAGGYPVVYDSSFSTSIGGYPAGAMLRAATLGNGQYWISSADDNTSNPDAGGANWIPYPNVIVQLQQDNVAADSGAINAIVANLSRAPASWSEIVGSPIRVRDIAFTTTSTTPTLKINALTAATIINADGSALSVGQIVQARTVEGIPCSDGKFQLTSPSKPPSVSTNPFIVGAVYGWMTNTVPTGAVEIAGQLLLIASYPILYSILNTRYGGDGVTKFKMPDYRGEFLRGWDHGRGLDPNAASRTNRGDGVTGDNVGTNQTGLVGPFTASGSANATGGSATGALILTAVNTGQTFASGGEPTPPYFFTAPSFPVSVTGGGAETRPVNIYTMFITGAG